jgi:hypothetical protein
MKNFLFAMLLAAMIGCTYGKELQVEMVKAELIKIDTVFRQPNVKKMLTWRDESNIEYVTFVSMTQSYVLGTSMMVLRQR